MKCILVVGYGPCGKTSLICSYLGLNKLLSEHILFSEVVTNGEKETLGLLDTPGHSRFHATSLDKYGRCAKAIVILFSVDNRDSFEYVRSFWVPQIHKHRITVPYVIVGNKTDLRQDAKTKEELEEVGQSFVTKEEGKALADEVKAAAYLECSALKREDAKNIFHKVFRIMGVEPPVETNSSSKKAIDTRNQNCTLL